MISIIVAIDKNRGIGLKNSIPWYLPEDLKFFKKTTLNHPVVMGRNTFLSIGKPLKDRENIVLSEEDNFDGVINLRSINEVLDYIKDKDSFIIGGARVYNEFIKYADNLYITEIEKEYEVDTYFPYFDKENYSKEIIEDHLNEDIPYVHALYRRIK